MEYLLTPEAQQDVDEITDYSLLNHGENRTALYLDKLYLKFRHISSNPSHGKHRIEIREGLYSSHFQLHTIFYRVKKDSVLILRVLHQSRDVISLI